MTLDRVTRPQWMNVYYGISGYTILMHRPYHKWQHACNLAGCVYSIVLWGCTWGAGIKMIKGAGDMAQQLIAPAALAEDPGLIPSTHTGAKNRLYLQFQGNNTPISDLHCLARHECTNLHADSTLIHIKTLKRWLRCFLQNTKIQYKIFKCNMHKKSVLHKCFFYH